MLGATLVSVGAAKTGAVMAGEVSPDRVSVTVTEMEPVPKAAIAAAGTFTRRLVLVLLAVTIVPEYTVEFVPVIETVLPVVEK